jgi:hypothetical protein
VIKNYAIWLALVFFWNFGYPTATPLQDVLIAVILAVVSHCLNRTL